MRPERIVEIKIFDWVITKSSFVKEVYFNQKNELNCKTFRTEKSQKKPDLIIQLNKGYGKKYYAIEVKDNSQSLNLLKSIKIINKYFKEYAENKIKYFINEEEIKIDGFLIVTQSSIKGYLYNHERIKNNLDANKDSGRYIVTKKYQIIPKEEGERTFDFVRQMWAQFNEVRDDYNIKPSIGILIANRNDNFSPHIMITSYNKNTKKWGQKWWKI